MGGLRELPVPVRESLSKILGAVQVLELFCPVVLYGWSRLGRRERERNREHDVIPGHTPESKQFWGAVYSWLAQDGLNMCGAQYIVELAPPFP